MTPRLAISQLCPPSSSSRKSRLTTQDPALGKHLLISMHCSALWLCFYPSVRILAQCIFREGGSHDAHACHHLMCYLRSCIAAQVLQSYPALPHRRKPHAIAAVAFLVCYIMGPTCILHGELQGIASCKAAQGASTRMATKAIDAKHWHITLTIMAHLQHLRCAGQCAAHDPA